MNVLIALDNSCFGQAAINSVIKQPWWGDTKFLILSVVPILAPAFNDFAPHWQEMLAIQAADKKLAEELVAAAAVRVKGALPYCSVETKVEEGGIVDKIIDTANEFAADLIIVGSHGRSGISKLLLGSVAESVLNRAPCSVEVVKMEKAPKADKQHAQSAVSVS